MWQEPFYVVQVYTVVFLKLVHPERQQTQETEGLNEL